MHRCGCDSRHAAAAVAPRMKPLQLQHHGRRGRREIPTLGEGKVKQSAMHCPAPVPPLKPYGAELQTSFQVVAGEDCHISVEHRWKNKRKTNKQKKRTRWSCDNLMWQWCGWGQCNKEKPHSMPNVAFLNNPTASQSQPKNTPTTKEIIKECCNFILPK